MVSRFFDPVVVACHIRVIGKLLQFELFAEALPQGIADHADENPFLVLTGEDVIDRPGAAPHGHGWGLFPQYPLLRDMLAHHKGGGLEQRAGNVFALAGGVAFLQGGQDADNPEHATGNIDHRTAGAHGLVR